MKRWQRILAVGLALCLVASYVDAAGIKQSIEVLWNDVRFAVNGTAVATDTLTYKGKTYVAVEAAAQALGGQTQWDEATRTLSLNLDSRSETVAYPDKVDALDPVLALSQLQIAPALVDAYKLEKAGATVPIQLEFDEALLRLKPDTWLEYQTAYTLKLFLSNGRRRIVRFETAGLPKLVPGYSPKIIFVPADPAKGFNYPYYLVLPTKQAIARNQGKRNYLFVETHNTGKTGDSLDFHIEEAMTIARNNSAPIAEAMGLPRIVPILVRPDSLFDGKAIYTHGLTRYTILLDQFKKQKTSYPEVFGPMDRVDFQVVAMIKHANEYLRANNWNMEDKVFIWGFSASGSFANRFPFLHPDMVKAACYGSFPTLPVSQWQGTNMIYPLGTYDYKQITGRDFDLAAYNNVAKLGYIGSADNNNPELAWDMWSPEEQAIIRKVLAVKEYPDQWEKYKAIFEQSGGQAQANVYIGAGHETFYKGMTQDYLNFFRANRISDKPVYVLPSDPATTKSDIYSNSIVTVEPEPFSYEQTTIIEAFWSGTAPRTLPTEFVEWFKTTDNYKYDANKLLLAIAEWDASKNHRQFGERLAVTGNFLTLQAPGHKDVKIDLSRGSMNGYGAQLYVGSIVNGNDMVSGVKYQIVDPSGHWVIPDGVYVMRPNR